MSKRVLYEIDDRVCRITMNRPDVKNAQSGPLLRDLDNAFERAAYRVFEGLDGVRQQIVRAGGDDVRLSGSGPTLFVLYPEAQEEAARELFGKLEGEGLRVFLVKVGRAAEDS